MGFAVVAQDANQRGVQKALTNENDANSSSGDLVNG